MTQSPAVPKPLREVWRPTTLIEPDRLAEHLGADLFLVSETHQRTGSFKFRAAYQVAATVSQTRIITASSGNFGQAMACACRMLGKRCTVVMPGNSARVKVDAVRAFGGAVEFIDVNKTERRARVAELARDDPGAYVASAYDDPLVMEGNASLGEEVAAFPRPCDALLLPIGGGGLASGVILGLRRAGRAMEIWGVEPAIANDAAESLRRGRIVANAAEPQTIADGARTLSVGAHNWPVLRAGLAGIVEVSEEQIQRALQLLFLLANVKAEPTGALSLAALLARPELFHGRAVGCVVSGGNVDPAVFCRLLEEGAPG